MKKSFILMSTLAVAALALFSCVNVGVEVIQDDNLVKETAGVPFEITVGTDDTKTANSSLSTTWVAGDKINLFHAVNGVEPVVYTYDGAFTTASDGSSVKFSGTLASELDGETSYDWYAIYPYVDNIYNTPAEFDTVTIGSEAGEYQVQTGNDSKAHLAGEYFPLYGKKANVAAATKPTITMKQLASVLAVKVTNRTASDITVSSITVTCSDISDGLVGEYQVNLSGATPVYTASIVNNTAKLSVTSGSALANGETGTFYLAVKPFTAPAGSKITIAVTTDQGTQTSVSNALGAAFTFYASKIHDLNFNYTNKALTAAEFKYNDSAWLTAQGIALPADGKYTNLTASTQTVSPISISTTDGTSAARVGNSGGNYILRMYTSGGSLTVSTSGDKIISKIAATGATFGDNASNLIASNGTVSGNSSNLDWSGLTQSVTFTIDKNLTIGVITVFYFTASDSDHVVSLPIQEKNVAYNDVSTTFDIMTVNVSDLVFSSTSPGFTSYSYDANTLTVNFEENPSASPRDIDVNVSSASAGFIGTLTVKQDGGVALISSLTSSSTSVTVNGQVTALTTKGFILSDGSGSILVYTNADATATYSIGQSVTVAGDVSAYGLGLQFDVNGGKATITPGADGSYDYPAATPYALAEVDAFLANAAERLATYVQFSGVIKKSGSYFNIIVGGGATPNATLYSAPTSLTSGLVDGDYVTVKGYASSISSSKMAVCATEVTESDTAPALLFSDVTNISAAGVTAQELTVTPYRKPGDAPSVTYTGCVTAASINAACTTVTFNVSENSDPSPKQGTIVITFTVGLNTYAYTIKVTQLANAKKQTWDLTTNSYATATTSLVTWSSSPITMTLAKGSSSSNANNYLGGSGSNVHTRFYKDQLLTITPASGKTILTIVFTCVSSYSDELDGSTWGNASHSYAGTKVTVTPTNGASAVTCTIGAATRVTSVDVEYTD